MKFVLVSVFLLFCIASTYCTQWADCGIPLTRKIYYQGVVVSPAQVLDATSSDGSISVNVNANLQSYTLDVGVQVTVLVTKDGVTYLDVPVGDLCSILNQANQQACPLIAGAYSFTYLYMLPPLPTGNYTVRIVTTEVDSGTQIGCLSLSAPVNGLGTDSCTYTSTFAANLVGTAAYGTNTIQIGPWGPNGVDLPYDWGTFRSVSASADLVGYSNTNSLSNYVWGITGTINTTMSGNTFQGTFVVGYRPDVTSNENALLVSQGTFSWVMSGSTPYVFQSGQFIVNPPYSYPTGFPYPLNFGNLGTFLVSPSSDGTSFNVKASRDWCRCDCDLLGNPNSGDNIDADNGISGSGTSKWTKGTIAIGVVGGVFLIVAVIFLVRMSKTSRRPPLYDDTDLMDPQKPDYGTIAINEVFDADERDYLQQ